MSKAAPKTNPGKLYQEQLQQSTTKRLQSVLKEIKGVDDIFQMQSTPMKPSCSTDSCNNRKQKFDTDRDTDTCTK